MRRQNGQAIALVALMMLVLLGFVGLAIDGGREYIQRRTVQNAADAAALAAGDNYLNSISVSSAEQAGANEFAKQMQITTAATHSNLGNNSDTVTWSGYTGSLVFAVSPTAFYTDFKATATSSLALAFMQVLGQGPTSTIGATATSVVFGLTQTPALLTLSQQGCPGTTGSSLSIQGNANVAIVGALYSDGGIASQSGATQVNVAGNAFDQCGSIPGTINLVCYNPNTNPPSSDGAPVNGSCPSGDTLGQYYTSSPPLPDPGYKAPTLPTTNSPALGSTVELSPGIYASDPTLGGSGTAVCYFLEPGVYDWSAGLTMNGSLVSNELRPPDEPYYNGSTLQESVHAGSVDSSESSFTTAAQQNSSGVQFWHGTSSNTVNCDGGFSVQSVVSSAHPLTPAGSNWGVIVTSVRTNDAGGYNRESAPSMCRPISGGLDGTSRGFQVAISNVPGAEAYNVYASPTGCSSSTFGYVGTVSNVNNTTETNGNTGNCPWLPSWPANNAAATPTTATVFNSNCSLGYEISQVFDSSILGTNFTVGSTYCSTLEAPTLGCAYPVLAPSNRQPSANDGGLQAPSASGLPDQAPIADLASNGGGDRADEYQCRAQSSSAPASNPCEGTGTTPGAVQFYFPSAACLSVQGSSHTMADLYIFGGRQYEGIVLYAPANNTCTMKLAGGDNTTIIGTEYMPGATLDVKGNSQTVISGQVIVYSATIDGTSGTAITYNPALSPPPPGAKLIQ